MRKGQFFFRGHRHGKSIRRTLTGGPDRAGVLSDTPEGGRTGTGHPFVAVFATVVLSLIQRTSTQESLAGTFSGKLLLFP